MDGIATWLLLLAVAILVALVLVIRARISGSSFAPWVGFTGRSPDYINAVRTKEDEATELARVRSPKDPAP